MLANQFDPSKTALVLIDLQRGITAFPAEPHSTAAVIANAALLAAAFRAAGAPVVLVRVATSPDGRDRLHSPVDELQVRRQMPPDFAEIVAELGPREGDIVVTKRQWGAFYGTDLDLQLRRRVDGTRLLRARLRAGAGRGRHERSQRRRPRLRL